MNKSVVHAIVVCLLLVVANLDSAGATVAALLGEDFVAADDRVAQPLSGISGGNE